MDHFTPFAMGKTIHLPPEPGRFAPVRPLLARLRSPRLEAFMLCNIGFWTAFAIAHLWCSP